MRGLKPPELKVDADRNSSHLLQMRGLKPPELKVDADRNSSHLLQMRGLKLNNRRFDLECEEVASFTDAWIETTLQRRV